MADIHGVLEEACMNNKHQTNLLLCAKVPVCVPKSLPSFSFLPNIWGMHACHACSSLLLSQVGREAREKVRVHSTAWRQEVKGRQRKPHCHGGRHKYALSFHQKEKESSRWWVGMVLEWIERASRSWISQVRELTR